MDSIAAIATSSPFAITDYHVAPEFGGDDALRSLKAAANAAGLRVMIDFVPNHMARDHRWTLDKPWLFVQGADSDAVRHRDRYFQPPATAAAGGAASANSSTASSDGVVGTAITAVSAAASVPTSGTWLAYGRDPHSGGWRDTVQLNYRHPQLRGIMKAILVWCVLINTLLTVCVLS